MGSGGDMAELVSGGCDDEDGCRGSGSGEVKRTLKVTDCKCMILTPLLKHGFGDMIKENYYYEYKEIMVVNSEKCKRNWK